MNSNSFTNSFTNSVANNSFVDDTQPSSGLIQWKYVGIFVGVLAIAALVWYGIQYMTRSSPWWSERANGWWWQQQAPAGSNTLQAVEEKIQALQKEIAQPDTTLMEQKGVAAPESWCFVGEDLTGRYCVRVPSSSACSPDRSYKSRSDCEMVPAHALPAGVIQDAGNRMIAFRDLATK